MDGDALFVAAMMGRVAEVKALLRRGADANAFTNEAGRTPLWAAVWAGSERVVALLLRAGAEVDATDARHETPLVTAVRDGHLRVASMLRAAGADLYRLRDADLGRQELMAYTAYRAARTGERYACLVALRRCEVLTAELEREVARFL